MSTIKMELGQKDTAVVLRDKPEGVDLEVFMPKGSENDAVTQPELCALYLAWAMEQEDIRSQFMQDMEEKRIDSEKGKGVEKN
tara:strand:+ start:3565 stop:3813 length:249 start_codon:yes stop_codon:yes gene_type:complete